MTEFIIIAAVVIFFIILLKSDAQKEKGITRQSYNDDKIINEYSSYYKQSEYIQESDLSNVSIQKYHESNYIVGSVHGGFMRKYRECEGIIYTIKRDEEHLYIRRFDIRIGNRILCKSRVIVKNELSELIKEAEAQFQEWCNKVEEKEKKGNMPDSELKRLNANRKYLSENKKKLLSLKDEGDTEKYNLLLSKMQDRYNEIIASGSFLKESQLKELEDLGIITSTECAEKKDAIVPQSKNCTSHKKKKLSIVFELKGLYYRTAFEQLAAVMLEVGDSLRLELEPDNDKDPTAIKVFTESNDFIGYVDKDQSALVTSVYDRIISCTVIKKTRHQIPYITCKIEFTE